MEDIKKLVRNLTGYNFSDSSKQQQHNHVDEED
jgi:hypothetical protein